MKRFNIVTKKSYTDRNGEEKKQWMNVGSLVHFPANGDRVEGYKLELNMFPNTSFSVFEQKPREEATVQRDGDPVDSKKEDEAYQKSKEVKYPEEVISPEDIPF